MYMYTTLLQCITLDVTLILPFNPFECNVCKRPGCVEDHQQTEQNSALVFGEVKPKQ